MLGLPAANASASVSSQDAAVSHCATLPLSQRGICKESALDSGAGSAAIATGSSHRAAAGTDNPRYEQAMAACKRLPISQYNTCSDEAKQWRTPDHVRMSAAGQARVRAENRRYQADLRECARLPLSERNTCASTSGTPQSLARPG